MSDKVNAKRTVPVCNKCLQASCFQGEFYCSEYRSAGVTQRTVKELASLGLEHSDYWKEAQP